MIFVTGASRSGTTLVSHLLGRHSEISGLREMHYFGASWSPEGHRRDFSPSEVRRAVKALLERQRRDSVTAQDLKEEVDEVLSLLGATPDSASVFAETVRHLAMRAGKSIPCEQTPRNIYYAEALLDSFPNSRFVHILRDPRAVLASQKSRWRKRALMHQPSRMSRLQQLRTWANYHPYIVAWLWNRATVSALRLQSHPRFRTIRFEDLISEPERTVRAVCEFLEVDYEAAMLDVEHVNSSYIPSTGHKTGFNKSPVDSWRNSLTADETSLVSLRCRKAMTQAGYQADKANVTTRSRMAFNLSFGTHLAGAVILNPRRVLIQGRGSPDLFHTEKPCGASASETHPGVKGEVAVARKEATIKRIFGLACTDTALDAAAESLVSCAQSGASRRVAFVNAHCLNESVRNPELQQALREADILYADGIGMALASRLHGERLTHNVNGTDLFPHLCNQAASGGVVLGLLGGAPGIADRCKSLLQQRYPSLQMTFVRHGFISAGEDDAIVAAINDSDVQVLLVAMGVPRQECWVRKYGKRLRVPVIISVGGLFDFVSGSVPRAPRVLRQLRMEWLFRLCVEPRRLFWRYVAGNPVFLFRALRYAVTRRFWTSGKAVAAGDPS